MSRMVRESEISGLRERLFFARSLLKALDADPDGAAGPRLALRGGAVFHLYSVLVGIARQAATHRSQPLRASAPFELAAPTSPPHA